VTSRSIAVVSGVAAAGLAAAACGVFWRPVVAALPLTADAAAALSGHRLAWTVAAAAASFALAASVAALVAVRRDRHARAGTTASDALPVRRSWSIEPPAVTADAEPEAAQPVAEDQNIDAAMAAIRADIERLLAASNRQPS
jgi:hypothetical protein